MGRLRRILHASDFSPASRAAFARALALAKVNRAELTVVHVFTPAIPRGGEESAPPGAYRAMLAVVRADAQRRLDGLVARARAAGVRARGLLLGGIPHDRIVRAAKSGRADLLVIGTHGRSGLARLFLGSVAARVIATAPCPVLTIRRTR